MGSLLGLNIQSIMAMELPYSPRTQVYPSLPPNQFAEGTIISWLKCN